MGLVQQDRIGIARAWMREQGADALVVRRVANFAWLSGGGRSFIGVNVDLGAAAVVVTADRVVVVSSNIEGQRLQEEELCGLGWEMVTFPWWQDGMDECLRGLIPAGRTLSDVPFHGSTDAASGLASLRVQLSQDDERRAIELGADTACALEAAVRSIRPGQSEFEIAGALAQQCLRRGIEPIVHLVAADDRIYTRRHPLPTTNTVARYAMVVVCGMRGGLVISATRLWHHGAPPDDLVHRWQAAALVDAEMIAASRPGTTGAAIFAVAKAAYARSGFPLEWQQHHQGGAAGYQSREWRTTDTATEVIRSGQIMAWNPSVAGAKSEDTILVGDGRSLPRIITQTGDWPLRPFETTAGTVLRPEILIAP